MTHHPTAADAGLRPLRAATTASLAAYRGELPARYQASWREEFDARLASALRPGAAVLDVGAGRHPTIPPSQRPPGCRYAGLDLSARELEAAPPGWYDDIAVADIETPVPELRGSFDLVVSFLVLEHVADLQAAFENIRSYLRPEGRFVAFFSGAFSAFGLANRLLPPRVSVFLLRRLLQRDPESVFPAYYDRCWASALQKMLANWPRAEIHPMWYGAGYFRFFRPLQAAYVGYEEWARLGGRSNLGPYYLVDATR